MKKKIICISLLFILIISGMILLNNKESKKDNLYINSKELSNNQSLAIFIEKDNGGYEKTTSIPTKDSGYTLHTGKSICEGNATLSWNKEKWGLEIDNVNKREIKCYLYFAKGITMGEILANKNKSTRTDFSTILTEDTTGTIYSAEDDYGTSYYYAGAVKDNWVKFAGYYWRIIRINGDGTIRMIYNGPTTDQTGETTQIGTSVFNTNNNDNMYVGYQYTSGEVHGRGTDSTIKGVLDTWYNNNLKDYSNYIATGNGANFCNDRQPSTDSSNINGNGGTGTTQTYYATSIRLANSAKSPTLKCMDTKDKFAISIGLITADEVAYAGGVWITDNINYYLYTNQYYWTMSPFILNSSGFVSAFSVWDDGKLHSGYVNDFRGVRPVINLKPDTVFVGSGFSSDPYIVS